MTSLLSQRDAWWIEHKLLPFLGLSQVQVQSLSDYQATYPDIWVDCQTHTITVTPEWAKQSTHERRKRLLHEGLHLIGLRHNHRSRMMGYYSRPERDALSMRLYLSIGS